MAQRAAGPQPVVEGGAGLQRPLPALVPESRQRALPAPLPVAALRFVSGLGQLRVRPAVPVAFRGLVDRLDRAPVQVVGGGQVHRAEVAAETVGAAARYLEGEPRAAVLDGGVERWAGRGAEPGHRSFLVGSLISPLPGIACTRGGRRRRCAGPGPAGTCLPARRPRQARHVGSASLLALRRLRSSEGTVMRIGFMLAQSPLLRGIQLRPHSTGVSGCRPAVFHVSSHTRLPQASGPVRFGFHTNSGHLASIPVFSDVALIRVVWMLTERELGGPTRHPVSARPSCLAVRSTPHSDRMACRGRQVASDRRCSN